MRKILISLIVVALCMPVVFAQRSGSTSGKTASTFTLAVTVNPATASVMVDGTQSKGNLFTLPAGNHTVQVSAPGYTSFTTTVNLTGNMTLPVTLAPLGFQLNVSANVKGASFQLSNGLTAAGGLSALLPPGQYTLTVTAPGYNPYSETFSLAAPLNKQVTLSMAQVQLSVSVNVKGATIQLSNGMTANDLLSAMLSPGQYTLTVSAPGFNAHTETINLSGPVNKQITLVPMQYQLSVSVNVKGANIQLSSGMTAIGAMNALLPPGQYTITVSAPGYQNYVETINLSGPVSKNIALQPAMAGYQVQVPAGNINTDSKGGHYSQMMLFVDGQEVKGFTGQISPGMHQLKVTSGGLQAVAQVTFEAGKNYIIEFFMGVNVK